MREPKEIVDEIEAVAVLSEGEDERFFGFAVIGPPFDSWRFLALRRFPASSIGPGCASVWHRYTEDRWTFYQDAPPELACSLYFGGEIEETALQPIDIEWNSPLDFTVWIEGERSLEWRVTTRQILATRLLNAGSGLTPRLWRRSPTVLSLMGVAAQVGLGTGNLRLTGRMPNVQTYIASPSAFWLVDASRAVIGGVDLGLPGPLPEQGRLGEFLIPQRGLFAIASAYL